MGTKITGMTPGVDAQGQMRRLSAVHAPTDHAFGILHRYLTLPAFHKDDSRHNRHHHEYQDGDSKNGPFPSLQPIIDLADRIRQTHHDTGENDQADSISDASLGNLLADPHDEVPVVSNRGFNGSPSRIKTIVIRPHLQRSR
jgi:hypothetical protein